MKEMLRRKNRRLFDQFEKLIGEPKAVNLNTLEKLLTDLLAKGYQFKLARLDATTMRIECTLSKESLKMTTRMCGNLEEALKNDLRTENVTDVQLIQLDDR